MDKEELKQNYASIHTLRMEGDGYWRSSGDRLVSISIHTLRMEGDHKHQSGFLQEEYFNPHPPHGG